MLLLGFQGSTRMANVALAFIIAVAVAGVIISISIHKIEEGEHAPLFAQTS